jgi:A/G-specific adenine glycosylase
MKNFSSQLNSWYKKNKRDLPWRQTKDPYKIWLSEVILQQTRIEQGLSYYQKFVEHFPTVKHLAAAPEEKVLKLWQGLGYYSRARNLHAAAKQIVGSKKSAVSSRQSGTSKQSAVGSRQSMVERNEKKQNGFPSTYDEIIKLKGVGQYTASAIASICFGEARAVVDGNVYRFLSRVFGVETPIDCSAGKKEFQELADELLDKKNCGDHNQAMMEFGARHCKPKNPLCGECPFEETCIARRKNKVEQLPVKEKKTKVRTRYLEYFVFDCKGKTFLKKRENSKDIWQHLYEFPLIEFSKKEREATILKKAEKEYDTELNVSSVSTEIKHVLSHQILRARFWHVKPGEQSTALKKNFLSVQKTKVNEYALPRLIDKHWNP